MLFQQQQENKNEGRDERNASAVWSSAETRKNLRGMRSLLEGEMGRYGEQAMFFIYFFCQGKKHTHTKIILSAQPPPVNHVPFLLLSLYSAHYNCNRYDYWSLMSSAEMRVLLAALCFTATQPRGFSSTKWMIPLPLCLHRLLSPACKSYVKTEDGMLSWKLCIFS